MDIGDAIHTAVKALKTSFGSEMTEKNLDIGVIKTSDPEKRFHVLTQEEISDLLKEVDWATNCSSKSHDITINNERMEQRCDSSLERAYLDCLE